MPKSNWLSSIIELLSKLKTTADLDAFSCFCSNQIFSGMAK